MEEKDKFEFEGDKLVKYTYISISSDVSQVRREVIIDKETFIKCFQNWMTATVSEPTIVSGDKGFMVSTDSFLTVNGKKVTPI